MSSDTPKSNSDSWVRVELNQKASKDWVLREIDRLQRVGDQTQQIATAAKDAARHSPRKSDLTDLRGSVSSWSKWFRGALVGLLSFVITVGGAALWQYSSMYTRMESLERDNARMRAAAMVLGAKHDKDVDDLRDELDADTLRVLQAINALSTKLDNP